MTVRDRPLMAVVFTAALLVSWTVLTPAVAIAAWTERSHSGLRLAEWAALWVFTVPVPAVHALTLRRAVAPLPDSADAERHARMLARLAPVLLLSANMALLSAFALIFGR